MSQLFSFAAGLVYMAAFAALFAGQNLLLSKMLEVINGMTGRVSFVGLAVGVLIGLSVFGALMFALWWRPK
jgi:hypothetical protein